MGKLLNVTQLAKVLNVSRVTVSNAIRDGILPVAKREKSGPKIDEDAARKIWADREAYGKIQSRHHVGGKRGGRPPKNGARPDSETPVPAEASAVGAPKTGAIDPGELKVRESPERRILRAKASQAEIKAVRDNLELQKRKGELVEVEEVRAKGAELGSVLMGALIALPDRLSQQFASMDDPDAIHELMQKEIDDMLATVRRMCGIDEDNSEEAATA